MKKSHIIGLFIIAIGIGIVITTFEDAGAYVSFSVAKEMAKSGDDSDIHVIGKLKKDTEGNAIGLVYDPVIDPNYFAFILADEDGVEQKVIHIGNKPQHFERTEKVVVSGAYKGEDFIAKEILLKCPSKYADEQVKAGIKEY